jgi:hypothetical protein
MAKIRAVVVEGDREHGYKRVQVLFGANSFVEITDNGGKINLLIGAHARGFIVDGSEASGPLEKLVQQVSERHPEWVWKEE